MPRLSKLDPSEFRFLTADDQCYHLGEYTAGGGYQASETNQQIYNLKKRPNAPAQQLRYKARAIAYWGREIADSNLQWDYCLANVTFVPLPCSKPLTHELYDDRMLRVLQSVAGIRVGLDIRPVLHQVVERDSQHEGGRLRPDEILQTLGLDPAHLVRPLKRTVILVDDVITRGSNYAAAKELVTRLPGVEDVMGLFLARTVHPTLDIEEIFGAF